MASFIRPHLLLPATARVFRRVRWFNILLLSCFGVSMAQSLRINTFPADVVSENRYRIQVNGQSVPVFRAGMNVYLVSFDFTGTAHMQVDVEEVDRTLANAAQWHAIDEEPKHDADYFKGHAIVRPTSRGVAVHTNKNQATFDLTKPGQYSLEAPGVATYRDEVLLIFANPPEKDVPSPTGANVLYLKAGLHYDHITLHDNQTLYLEQGAVLVGAVNVWNAKHVTIRGRGTVIYQDLLQEGKDNGPYNIPNQHALTTSNVDGLRVEGVTFVVRARTWSVQLVRTQNVLLDNIKIVNVTENNINGDGIDWMDCSHAKVINTFIRSSDDNLAFLSADALKDFRPSDPARVEHLGTLTDFEVKDCVFWNTYASMFRLGWTSQSLTTSNIHLDGIDMIHGKSLLVIGIPKRPAHANHSNYLIENIRFEDPAKVVDWSNDPTATYRNFVFRNITLPERKGGDYFTAPRDGVSFEDIHIVKSSALP